MTINYEELCHKVKEISRKTGEFIREEAKKINREHVEVKGTHNYVTYVDKTAEKLIVRDLIEILPEAGFITEENTIEKEKKDWMWIIDPLDGTTNFIHGLPCFSISIALMHRNEPVIGVIYDINLDECFYAWEGGPALMNGNPIRVSNAPELKDSLLATGFPYYDYSLLDKYMQLFTWCLKNTHGVRRIGSAAIDLAWVACGRFEAFFEYGLNAWDVAAGVIILKQAGGRTGDFKGGNDYLFGGEIIASNSLIYEEFLKKTKETLY